MIDNLHLCFSYPLPNDNGRYNLSEEELVELLQEAYDNGYEVGRAFYQPVVESFAESLTSEWF